MNLEQLDLTIIADPHPPVSNYYTNRPISLSTNFPNPYFFLSRLIFKKKKKKKIGPPPNLETIGINSADQPTCKKRKKESKFKNVNPASKTPVSKRKNKRKKEKKT